MTTTTEPGGPGEPPEDTLGRPRRKVSRKREQVQAQPKTPGTPIGPTAQAAEPELSIPEESTYVPDPTGFQPSQDAVEVKGRRMHPLTHDDLVKGHLAHAGNVNIRGDPAPGAAQQQRQFAQEDARQTAERYGGNQAEDLMPDYLKDDPQPQTTAYQTSSPQQAPVRPPGGPGGPPAGPPPGGGGMPPGGDSGGRDDSAMVVSALIQESNRAREAGDPLLAVRLQKMAEAALGDTTVRRVPPKVERSIILDKLRRNLGLKAIESKAIEWGGMKWHFAPTPSTLDYWLYARLPEEPISRTMAVPALGISTGLIGLDDVPLWQALNIPINADYEIDIPLPGLEEGTRTERVPVSLHTKFCPGCSSEVHIDATKCAACGAALDIMNVPASLRIQYAEKMYDWFQNEFGPFEKLPELWVLMNDAVKNRADAKEETYPLLDWSTKETTTPDSLPGDE